MVIKKSIVRILTLFIISILVFGCNNTVHKEEVLFSFDVIGNSVKYTSLQNNVVGNCVLDDKYSHTNIDTVILDTIDEISLVSRKILFDDSNINEDRLCFSDTIIDINSVIYSHDSLKTQISFTYSNGYKFKLSSKKYCLLFYIEDIPSVDANLIGLLFDYSVSKNIFRIPNTDFEITDVSNFGDFNNDNVLDFIDFNGEEVENMSNMKIPVYSIQNRKFVRDSIYYLSVENEDNALYVDVDESNWYIAF